VLCGRAGVRWRSDMKKLAATFLATTIRVKQETQLYTRAATGLVRYLKYALRC